MRDAIFQALTLIDADASMEETASDCSKATICRFAIRRWIFCDEKVTQRFPRRAPSCARARKTG